MEPGMKIEKTENYILNLIVDDTTIVRDQRGVLLPAGYGVVTHADYSEPCSLVKNRSRIY